MTDTGFAMPDPYVPTGGTPNGSVDAVQFLNHVLRHGNGNGNGGNGNGNGGGKGRNRRGNRGGLPKSPTAPLTYQQIMLLANHLLAPYRRQALGPARAREALGKSVAGIYAGVSPQVSQAYQDAAALTQGAAQGFSGDLQGDVSGQNADIQSFLDKIGGGGFTAPNAGAASDALYGTQGYIPSTSLAREGAGFASAAAQLPATAASQTALDAAGLRRQGLTDLGQRRVDLIRELLNEELQKKSIDINAGYLGLAGRKQNFDQAMAIAGAQKQQHDQQQSHHHDLVTKYAGDFQDAHDAVWGNLDNLKVKNPDPLAGVDAAHPEFIWPSYDKASRQLYNQYSYLLDEAHKAGIDRSTAILKLKTMIRQALESVGIIPEHVG